jgi:methionyl-tRNA formyltransferase
MLKNILVLSSHEAGEKIINILTKKHKNIIFKIINSNAELEQFDKIFLSHARLISFFSAVIVSKNTIDSLGFGAINFHPGPPNYPGWAASNFAVYEGVKSFGVTAHYMNEEVDRGEIIAIDLFAVKENIDVNELVDKSIDSLINLMHRLSIQLVHEEPIIPLQIPWGARRTTKKMFNNYCQLEESISKEEFLKRVKAFGGFSTSSLQLNSENRVFVVDHESTVLPGKAYKMLHGVRFVEK